MTKYNGAFEKKVPDIIFPYYDERSRDLRMHNEVENGVSLVYCVKFKVTFPFELYYVMYSGRDGVLVIGKEPEFLQEMYIVEKKLTTRKKNGIITIN